MNQATAWTEMRKKDGKREFRSWTDMGNANYSIVYDKWFKDIMVKHYKATGDENEEKRADYIELVFGVCRSEEHTSELQSR